MSPAHQIPLSPHLCLTRPCGLQFPPPQLSKDYAAFSIIREEVPCNIELNSSSLLSLVMDPSTHSVNQYAGTTDKLTTRMAIYSYSINPQTWFSWLGERITLTGDILEVGAGTGELWKHVDRSNARLTLTDFSPAMCDQLREIPNAVVQQCDAASLPFQNASFDVVLASHMLYHLDDPDAALKEFTRILRPQGKLFAALGRVDSNKELRLLGESIGRPFVVFNTTRITADSAPEYLKRYFAEIKEEQYPGDLEVPNPEPLLAYLGSLGEVELTDEQNKLGREIIETKIQEEGSFRVTKAVVLFTASRS
jgi:ubiquinone/menaquinone biosynthesis C-methylase UbiE